MVAWFEGRFEPRLSTLGRADLSHGPKVGMPRVLEHVRNGAVLSDRILKR